MKRGQISPKNKVLIDHHVAKYMRKELEANYTKGDRNGELGWLNIKSKKFWLGELYYHVGKLQSALMSNDIEQIKENCADVANIAMMILDTKIDLLNGNDIP